MKFYVTFGQKYRREQHPRLLKAHPDGWVEIDAPSRSEARELVVRLLEQAWAAMYDEEFLDEAYLLYPRGAIAKVEWDGTGTEAFA